MELLTSNGWEKTGTGCKCEGSPPIYSKGEYTISINRGKTFKLRRNKKLVTHRRLSELEYWLNNNIK